MVFVKGWGTLHADSMAIIGERGGLPVFKKYGRPMLSLAHVTTASPHESNLSKTVKSHLEFRKKALSNLGVHEVLKKNDLFGDPGNMGILFGLQHAPSELEREHVEDLFAMGIRSMAIVHENKNVYGGGFRSEAPLTWRGAQLIRWLGECGIILDLSHASHQTMSDALALIRREGLPTHVMASHSGAYAHRHHPRNLTGAHMSQIRDLQGYIGIPATTYLLTERDEPYLDHFVEENGF